MEKITELIALHNTFIDGVFITEKDKWKELANKLSEKYEEETGVVLGESWIKEEVFVSSKIAEALRESHPEYFL